MSDDRSGLAVGRVQQILGVRDDDLLSSCPQKLERGFDLRFHASFLEMAQVFPKKCARNIVKDLLVRFLVVQTHVLNVRRNDEFVESKFGRQKGRSAVLVDDGFDTGEPAVPPHHRDASSSSSDHHDIVLEAVTDDFDLDDINGEGGWYHAPVST